MKPKNAKLPLLTSICALIEIAYDGCTLLLSYTPTQPNINATLKAIKLVCLAPESFCPRMDHGPTPHTVGFRSDQCNRQMPGLKVRYQIWLKDESSSTEVLSRPWLPVRLKEPAALSLTLRSMK